MVYYVLVVHGSGGCTEHSRHATYNEARDEAGCLNMSKARHWDFAHVCIEHVEGDD